MDSLHQLFARASENETGFAIVRQNDGQNAHPNPQERSEGDSVVRLV